MPTPLATESIKDRIEKNIHLPADQIADFCTRWKITELALFGSVLRADFRPDSDIDILATFAPESDWSLFDHVYMQDELKVIFERPIDLFTRWSVENSKNPFRRKSILNSAQVIHVAG